MSKCGHFIILIDNGISRGEDVLEGFGQSVDSLIGSAATYGMGWELTKSRAPPGV